MASKTEEERLTVVVSPSSLSEHINNTRRGLTFARNIHFANSHLTMFVYMQNVPGVAGSF